MRFCFLQFFLFILLNAQVVLAEVKASNSVDEFSALPSWLSLVHYKKNLLGNPLIKDKVCKNITNMNKDKRIKKTA